MSTSVYRCQSLRRDETELQMPIKEITNTRVHCGYRQVRVPLRREGRPDNVKDVSRLYRQGGLSLRLKRLRHNKAAQLRASPSNWHSINEMWSMGFLAHELFSEFVRRCCLQPAMSISQERKSLLLNGAESGTGSQRLAPRKEHADDALQKWLQRYAVLLGAAQPLRI